MYTVSIFMMIYGVAAAIGNIIGGKMADRHGVDQASQIIVTAIVMVLLAMWLLVSSPVSMAILVALLGLLSFAAVPALQARLLGIAEVHAPGAHSVAAGLNIAGFNSGIALGSLIGGVTISTVGISYTGAAAAIVSGIGLLLLLLQVDRSKSTNFTSAESNF
jgi:predicted MFS family arabinose efflux permease